MGKIYAQPHTLLNYTCMKMFDKSSQKAAKVMRIDSNYHG